MAALSDFLEAALLNHVLRGTAYTAPSAVYLALFTSATTDAGGGNEVSGGSYERKVVTFAAPSGGTVSNNAAVTFADMPAVTVTHMAIMSAQTGGNMLWHGPVGTQRTYEAGDSATVAVGAVVAGLD